MKVTPLFVAILASVIPTVQPGSIYDRGAIARHAHIAHRSESTTPLASRSLTRRCPSRSPPKPVTTSPAASHATSGSAGGGGGGGGTIGNVHSSCGPSGATTTVTATTGPNGRLGWLNCGVDGSGWNPPHVTVSDLIVSDLGYAVNQAGSPFKACGNYIGFFEQYGNQFGIPPIMLASFAMQESSCRADTVGGAGEQGLMQLTRDKCGGAPGGNCQDPDFNIRTGARYIKQTLDDCGGNVIQAVGTYNGWHLGLTVGEATAAAYGSCCRCQNNLDYLQQFFNGWLQNINAYTHNPPLGQYFNLNVCSH
jgi:hypothetical protein